MNEQFDIISTHKETGLINLVFPIYSFILELQFVSGINNSKEEQTKWQGFLKDASDQPEISGTNVGS